ncbi:MAG: hypothetical protein QNJ54_03030 [Prochloraceae cyanobacterium]|nr:hypothetical protein [Prochloraceae cyanobacterium]
MTLQEARNSNTTTARLQEILDLENKEICQAIAINPNTIINDSNRISY